MRKLNARALIEAVGGKGLIIPKEGWNRRTFALYGRAMIVAMHRASNIIRRQAQAEVARRASQTFHDQLSEIVHRFMRLDRAMMRRSLSSGRKAGDLEIFLEADKRLFLDVVDAVLKDSGSKTRAKVIGPIRSVLDQAYSKTSILMAQKPIENNDGLNRRALKIGEKITNVSERTRGTFVRVLDQAVEEKLSVADTVRRITAALPKVNDSRALTIARTELTNAWAQGAIQSFKESSTVTEVSVIGCESREEERWKQPSYQQYLYRGESTCNIADVPIVDAEKLVWHPNHTGTIIPTAFRED